MPCYAAARSDQTKLQICALEAACDICREETTDQLQRRAREVSELEAGLLWAQMELSGTQMDLDEVLPCASIICTLVRDRCCVIYDWLINFIAAAVPTAFVVLLLSQPLSNCCVE